MTAYKLRTFTIADAETLVGKIADITEWDDDELESKVTYRAARIIGIIDRIGPYLLIETTGAEMTDARTGAHLGTRPAEPELHIGFTWICEVTDVRDCTAAGQALRAEAARTASDRATRAGTDHPVSGQPGYQRGDRVALEYTSDPYTRLTPGDEGTVTGYDPKLGQLNIRWDSGSTLALLLRDGDQVRLITPAPGQPPASSPRATPSTPPASTPDQEGDEPA